MSGNCSKMQILNATIDCWLWAGRLQAADYSDYQHHHWDLSPSQDIDHVIRRYGYNWTIDDNGHDTGGTWNLSHGMVNSQYEILINSANQVILNQTHGYGVNSIRATGSTISVSMNQVSELIMAEPDVGL